MKDRPSVVRLAACAGVALVVIALVWSFVANPRIHWSVVGECLFSKDILDGVLMTIILRVYAMAVGVVIGIALALMRLSDDRFLSGFARSYVTIMRGIPALVQLIFWYNLAAIFPHIGFSLPGIGAFFVDANKAISKRCSSTVWTDGAKVDTVGPTKRVVETTLSPEIATAARRTRKGTPNHPIEFRRELAKLACEPGVSVARLALEHGLNTNLLFKWRRAYQVGQYEPPTLLPVEVAHEERTIADTVALPVQSQSKAHPVVAGVIEISVGIARVRIEGTPDAATLRVVLRTLRAAAEADA